MPIPTERYPGESPNHQAARLAVVHGEPEPQPEPTPPPAPTPPPPAPSPVQSRIQSASRDEIVRATSALGQRVAREKREARRGHTDSATFSAVTR